MQHSNKLIMRPHSSKHRVCVCCETRKIQTVILYIEQQQHSAVSDFQQMFSSSAHRMLPVQPVLPSGIYIYVLLQCAILIITQYIYVCTCSAPAAFYTHYDVGCKHALSVSMWLSDTSLMLIPSSDVWRQCVFRMRYYTRLKMQAWRSNCVWYICLIAPQNNRILACLNAALTKRQHNYLSVLLPRYCVLFLTSIVTGDFANLYHINFQHVSGYSLKVTVDGLFCAPVLQA